MTPNSSNANRAAAPNLTLDPQGFHGTSSARRARQSRQKRRLRTFAFTILLLLGAGALGWRALQPRAQGFAVAKARALPLDLSAPATLDGKDNLWLTSDSGALWRIDSTGQSARYGMATTAAAPPFISDSGGVYVTGLDGTLSAFGGPGRARWTRNLGASLATTPQLWRAGEGAIVAVGDSDGQVTGLNASDGKTLWSARLGGPIGDGLATTRDGFIAPTLASGVWRGGLVGLDGKTGRVKWRYPRAGTMAAGVATPLFDKGSDRVYWNNDEGVVASLDASNGRIWWHTEVALAGAPQSVMLRARPVLFGQSVIVGGSDGVLRSLDAGNGRARWSADLGAPIRSLSAANVAGRPAVLAQSEREAILVDASAGTIIGRETARRTWLVSGGRGAVMAGENGSWRRVSW